MSKFDGLRHACRAAHRFALLARSHCRIVKLRNIALLECARLKNRHTRMYQIARFGAGADVYPELRPCAS
jgi:hypothetical protein